MTFFEEIKKHIESIKKKKIDINTFIKFINADIQKNGPDSPSAKREIEHLIATHNKSVIRAVMWNITESYPIEAIEKEIIKLQDPEISWIFLKSKRTNRVNTPAFGNIFMSKGTVSDCLNFAKTIKENNTLGDYKELFVKFGKHILTKGSVSESYNWLIINDKRNIPEHVQKIISSKDIQYNYLIAQEIKGIDITAPEKVILDSKDLYYNISFASNIIGADKDAHGTVVAQSANEQAISKFENIVGRKYLHFDLEELNKQEPFKIKCKSDRLDKNGDPKDTYFNHK